MEGILKWGYKSMVHVKEMMIFNFFVYFFPQRFDPSIKDRIKNTPLNGPKHFNNSYPALTSG